MRLWTIQTPEVYRLIMETGVYRCDPYQSGMLMPVDESKACLELDKQFTDSYDWLVRQMEKRIGPRPEGVSYPVWAWYQYGFKRNPDLRKERWSNGNPGEKLVCIFLEMPDDQVLLSDFHTWHFVLNRWPISDTEEEADRVDAWLETVSEQEKQAFLEKNWERIFEIEPFDNGYTSRGDDVQATFWELKKEYVLRVKEFTAAGRKNSIGRNTEREKQ